MSIEVAHTCPYIDDVIQMLETIHQELEPLDRAYKGPIAMARSQAWNAINIMEDVRCMNAELRDEGETALEDAEMYEAKVEEWQDIASELEEELEQLKKEIFDAEN